MSEFGNKCYWAVSHRCGIIKVWLEGDFSIQSKINVDILGCRKKNTVYRFSMVRIVNQNALQSFLVLKNMVRNRLVFTLEGWWEWILKNLLLHTGFLYHFVHNILFASLITSMSGKGIDILFSFSRVNCKCALG